jgi:hypothetical protein
MEMILVDGFGLHLFPPRNLAIAVGKWSLFRT